MDAAEKLAEVALGPVGCTLAARDTRIVERDGWYQVITASSRSVSGNEIVRSRIAAADADAVVRATCSEYAAAAAPFRWSVNPLTEPRNFGATLEAHGFRGSDGRGMAIAPVDWAFAPPRAGITVERVTAATLDDYLAADDAGWERRAPDPVARRDDHLRALATGRFHFFVARVLGAIAGSAGFVTKPRSAFLVGGVVLATHRGAGVYRALLDARLHAIVALGLPLATTHARESTSAPILARFGFETIYRARMYFSPQ